MSASDLTQQSSTMVTDNEVILTRNTNVWNISFSKLLHSSKSILIKQKIPKEHQQYALNFLRENRRNGLRNTDTRHIKYGH